MLIDLSISIVSTNEKHYIKPLLDTIYSAAKGINIEIIIIDNASTDGVEELKDYPYVNIIKNKTRESFSANHNIGIKCAVGRYVLVLNPDIIFSENSICLTEMVRFMDEHQDCGVSGCRVYNYDKKFAYPARKFQAPGIILSRRFPKFFYSKKVEKTYFYQEYDINDTFECEWLSGCFLLFRKEAIHQIKGFDTGYKKYFEDVDVCERISQFGWKVYYHGVSFYYHLEQRASKKLLSKDAYLHLCSYLRWIWLSTKRKIF